MKIKSAPTMPDGTSAASLGEEKVTKEMADGLEDEVSLPYVVEDVTLMSPGTWNGMKYTKSGISKALEETDFESAKAKNDALFLDHKDRQSAAYVGRVKNFRMDGDDLKGDLEVVDKQTAMLLEYGVAFGVSPKVIGRSRDGKTMEDFEYDNFSIVPEPAVKTTYLNKEVGKRIDKEDATLSKDDLADLAETFGFEYDEKDELDLNTIIQYAIHGDAMSKEESTPDEGDELSKDEIVDSVAEKVMERVDDKLDELENDPEAESEPEEVDEEPEEAPEEEDVDSEEFDDFEEYAKERMKDDPDASLTEIAEEYEEEQKSTEDKLEELSQKFEDRIDSLESKLEDKEETIEEMEDKVGERASVRDTKPRQEKVQELSDKETEELDSLVYDELAQKFGISRKGE